MTEDKLNITIRIAGQKPVALKINRADEERVRNAEYQVNRLWSRWLQRFPEKNSTEVLAMVAYQFAELYFNAIRVSEETNTVLEKFETELDTMLHGFGADISGDRQEPVEDNKDSRPDGGNPWIIS